MAPRKTLKVGNVTLAGSDVGINILASLFKQERVFRAYEGESLVETFSRIAIEAGRNGTKDFTVEVRSSTTTAGGMLVHVRSENQQFLHDVSAALAEAEITPKV